MLPPTRTTCRRHPDKQQSRHPATPASSSPSDQATVPQRSSPMKVRHPVRWNKRGWFEVPREVGEPARCRHRFGDDLGRDRSDHTAGFRGRAAAHDQCRDSDSDSVQAGFDYLLRHVRRPPRLHRPGRTEDRDCLHLGPGDRGWPARQGRSCRSKADRATRRSSRTSGTRSCTAHSSPTGTCSPSTTVVPANRPTSTAPSYRTSRVRRAGLSSTQWWPRVPRP